MTASFDVEGFKAAVEVVFTAQEILVGNADYPTQKIAENTRRFRQLGLGYANLGALLMAQGLPYDSEAGRAWAAAITALMTGHAYATSARTAGRMGPFAGYPRTGSRCSRCCGCTATRSNAIDEALVPDDVLGCGAPRRGTRQSNSVRSTASATHRRRCWRRPVAWWVGRWWPPTRGSCGCARSATRTGRSGRNWRSSVLTDDGPRRATRFYVNGLEPVVDVRTKRGYRIQGTTKHRIRVVDRGRQLGMAALRRPAPRRHGAVGARPAASVIRRSCRCRRWPKAATGRASVTSPCRGR